MIHSDRHIDEKRVMPAGHLVVDVGTDRCNHDGGLCDELLPLCAVGELPARHSVAHDDKCPLLRVARARGEARRRFTVEDHARATDGVECRKDEGVIDETPAAYKPIDAVMAAQADLVDVVHTLRQVVCVKG